MKNILKSTVALPFKFIKGIFELMKALLNTILKLFGHPGLPTGGAHSAENMAPEEAHSDSDVEKRVGLNNKPDLEFAKKIVNDQTLKSVKGYVNAENRSAFDMSKLSASLRGSVVISTLIHAKGILQVTGNT